MRFFASGFLWISFPQAPEYDIRAVSNFFENSRRYSQLKVCHRCQRHRWQMEKTFKLQSFNNFVWTPLGSRVNIYINFCLQVHFKVSAAWYCCHYLPTVSTTPVANLELWISLQIFKKILNGLNGIIRGLGETDSWKKPEVKILVTLSLYHPMTKTEKGRGPQTDNQLPQSSFFKFTF